jgi:hypothetical protein
MILTATFSNTTHQMPIQVSCVVNDVIQWSADVLDSSEVLEIKFDDRVEQVYKIKFVFAGKENVENEYVTDTAIIIDAVTADGVDLTPVLCRSANYIHNTNGQSDVVKAQYTDFVGVDGSIEFEFETPIFKWLYRNYSW